MRCFTALRLEPAPGPALESWLAETRVRFPELAVTSPPNVHLTLVFLGELDSRAVEAAGDAITEAASGFGGFALGWGDVGAFPALARPRVLWLGVSDSPAGGRASVVELQSRLAGELRRRGLLVEDRPFRSHLTLARVRHPPLSEDRRVLLQAWLESVPAPPVADVTGIGLYGSTLEPGGAVHTLVREAAFARSPG